MASVGQFSAASLTSSVTLSLVTSASPSSPISKFLGHIAAQAPQPMHKFLSISTFSIISFASYHNYMKKNFKKQEDIFKKDKKYGMIMYIR